MIIHFVIMLHCAVHDDRSSALFLLTGDKRPNREKDEAREKKKKKRRRKNDVVKMANNKIRIINVTRFLMQSAINSRLCFIDIP